MQFATAHNHNRNETTTYGNGDRANDAALFFKSNKSLRDRAGYCRYLRRGRLRHICPREIEVGASGAIQVKTGLRTHNRKSGLPGN